MVSQLAGVAFGVVGGELGGKIVKKLGGAEDQVRWARTITHGGVSVVAGTALGVTTLDLFAVASPVTAAVGGWVHGVVGSLLDPTNV